MTAQTLLESKDDTNRHAEVDGAKPRGPQPDTENYRPLTNAEREQNSLPQ